MSDVGTPTFEQLRLQIALSPRTPSQQQRAVTWVGGRPESLGYARDGEGKLEVFLVGPELISRLPDVARRVQFDSWVRKTGDRIRANRILLPEGEHVDAIAAAILVELLRHGAQDDMQLAFSRTELLISMALAEPAPQNAVVTGLAGELSFLRLLRNVPGMGTSDALAAWKGFDRSSRDFQVRSTGFEIKTTTTGESRHHIQGWYQVEPGVPVEGSIQETALYLVSIGIEWLPQGSEASTLADLVRANRIGLTTTEWAEFLRCVRAYCGESFSVDEDGNAADDAFNAPFQIGFVRAYDMSDPAIGVITQADVEDRVHVVPDTVSFDILLPRVIGFENPKEGWTAVSALIESAQGAIGVADCSRASASQEESDGNH